MWLSRKLSQHEMQDVASAQDGTVTIEGGDEALFKALCESMAAPKLYFSIIEP